MSYDNSADRERDVNPPEPKEHYEPEGEKYGTN